MAEVRKCDICLTVCSDYLPLQVEARDYDTCSTCRRALLETLRGYGRYVNWREYRKRRKGQGHRI